MSATSASNVEELLIRPIEPEDKRTLIEGFDRLSQRSRYRRFLSPHPRLTDAELHYFTEVDHHDHEALIALDPVTDAGIGVARYVRSEEDPAVAELAITVVDDWQGRGVGSRLAAMLAQRAREEGIAKFTALLLADNELMLNLLSDLGTVSEQNAEQGTVELTVDLRETGLARLLRLLRAIALGELTPLPALRLPRAQGPAST